MRNFSQFCCKFVAASVLVLALACTTFAGDMQLPAITSQPPPATTGDMQFPNVTSSPETTNGDMQFPGATEIALTFLQSALSLF